jgi:hypothetical protein
MRNPQLGSLVREVARQKLSAGEKARLLTEGASKLRGVRFERLAEVPGTVAVFRGAPRGTDGKSPILAVLADSRVCRGFDDALIVDPTGKTNGLRILISRLEEIS